MRASVIGILPASTPTRVGPQACEPAEMLVLCACVCGRPHASPASGLSRHVSQWLVVHAAVCSIASARPVKTRLSGAGRAGCAVCVHVRAVCVSDAECGLALPRWRPDLAIGGESTLRRAREEDSVEGVWEASDKPI